MESISLTKRLLVAGGILVCGYIAYCILRSREEELKQQEVTEEADFIIIVENKDSKNVESKKDKVKAPLRSNDDEVSEKAITKLSVVKNVPTEVFTNEKSNGNLEMTSEQTKSTDEVSTAIDTLEVDPQITKNVNDIEVVKPIQVTVATKEKVANDDFPLQLGSKGKRVWNLKVYLLRNHGASGIVTDDYDTLTAERVKRYLKTDTVTEQLYMKLNMEGNRKKKRNDTKKKY